MKIAIDISQTVYPQGVGRLTSRLVSHLIEKDKENTYVLFFATLRGELPAAMKELAKQSNVTLKKFPFPPTFLHILWNVLHIVPIELFIGKVDVFLSSDWTEPPTLFAKKVSIIHDLSVYLYPEEAHKKLGFSLKNFAPVANIVAVQKKRLSWVAKECDQIIAVSEATKNDIINILHIPQDKITVIYEGVGI